MIRRVVARWLLAVSLTGLAASAHAQSCSEPWWLWQAFTEHFVLEDGRVLDPSTPQQHSTSEGQSYAMFFALMNNDPEAFETIWRWSVANLAQGNMRTHLPAWYWGKSDQGKWGVLDSNSASDANLWFVYVLFEASQKWRRPDYLEAAKALLALIEQHEIAELPGLGAMLLPGKDGFKQKGQNWVLNPSYLPLPVLRKMASISSFAGWQRMPDSLKRLLAQSSPTGFAPDWVAYQGQSADTGVFLTSSFKGGVGSYDAIRTYLWASVTHPDDELSAPILKSLYGMRGALSSQGLPPEKVDIAYGVVQGTGPYGFSAALIPYFLAHNAEDVAAQQRARVLRDVRKSLKHAQQQNSKPSYYDFVLTLYALGWDEGLYRFRRDGGVDFKWEKTCPRVVTL